MTKYWCGKVPATDDLGNRITRAFIDGRSRSGPWGLFTPGAWKAEGCGRLGTGYGQRYEKQSDGRWLKVQG